MNKLRNLFFLIFAITFFVSNKVVAQYNIPKIPKFQTSLYDYGKVLSAQDSTALEHKLVRYSDSTSTQIVIVTIPNLKGEDISQLATRWGHTWRIGQEKEDNGIFILLAKEDRKIHIVNGYGIEDRLTAGQTGEIIRNVIIPYFKQEDYYGGLNAGTDAIFEALNGKYKGERIQNNMGSIVPLLIFLLIIVIFLIIIFSSKNRGGGGGSTGSFRGPDLDDIIILSRMGRGRGYSGGNYGGGFGGGFSGGSGGFGGGFGGGGFSGGGAGGSW